jgi:hypothetical protein
MKPKEFPYEKFVNTKGWKIVESAIADLVENGDLIEQTARKYIVGYLMKKLDESKNIDNK